MLQNEMPIEQSSEFSCELRVWNRIVKAAMEEALDGDDNQPNEQIYRLYDRWANGLYGFLTPVMCKSTSATLAVWQI